MTSQDTRFSSKAGEMEPVSVTVGIVSCGDRSSARSEYSVIEGSAANSGNVGAARFGESRSARMPWHSTHHFSAKSFPAMLAGIWGILWALTQLRQAPIIGLLAAAAYGLHTLVALIIILWTPLGFGWKCLIVGSSLVFLALPPMTWRLLQRTHDNERSEHGRESP